MKLQTKAIAAAVAALSMVGAQAAFLIDDFSTGQAQLQDFTTGALPINTAAYGTNLAGGVGSSVAGGGIIGGERDLMVYKVSGAAVDEVSARVNGGPGGLFSYSSPSQTSGFAVLRWDGVNAFSNGINVSGLGGVDLFSNGLGIRVSSDADLAYQLTMQVWTETAPMVWTLSEITNNAPAGVTFQDFLFANFAGADFTKVGALQLIINTGAATPRLDVDVDFIGNVPEPTTLALAGLALLGLGLSQRKRKSVK